MKNTLARVLIILSPICACISAKADYSPNFSTGFFPKGVTVANETGVVPPGDFYKHGWTEEGWTVDIFGSIGYVAVSPTHTGDGSAVRNVLTLPVKDIEEGMWLRWNARSLLKNFPESYSVEITPEGGVPEVIFSTDAEESRWVTRMVSLEAYAGCKCAVSFVCTSADKYLLMLDAISLTVPQKPLWKGTDRTRRFAGPAGTDICGTLLNAGAKAAVKSIVWMDGEGNVGGSQPVGSEVPVGGELQFSIHATGDMDSATEYSVAVEYEDGTREAVSGLTGSFYTSSFERRHLVDKGTGMWCVNCPTGNVLLDALLETYGDSMIPVETHVNDVLAQQEYFDALGYRNVPAFRLDRNATVNNKFEDMAQYYDVPTRFDIRFRKVETGEDSAALGVTVTAAEDFDNASGRYRVGYLLTADFSSPDYYQQNNTSLPSGEEYYYLPKRIPGSMLTFHDVTLTCEGAFDGIENSLPTAITAYAQMTADWSVARPELLQDMSKATAVAYVLDTETGIIMNADSTPLDKNYDYTSVIDLSSERDAITVNALSGQNFEVTLPAAGECTLSAYDLAGRLCASVSSRCAAGGNVMSLPLDKGVYLVRALSESGSATLKIVR